MPRNAKVPSASNSNVRANVDMCDSKHRLIYMHTNIYQRYIGRALVLENPKR